MKFSKCNNKITLVRSLVPIVLNMLNTLNHAKDNSNQLKQPPSLKQTKSFTSAIAHIDTSSSSKPPSNNKSGTTNSLQGQYTRTIDQTISSKIMSHHSIGHSSKQNPNISSSHDNTNGLSHH